MVVFSGLRELFLQRGVPPATGDAARPTVSLGGARSHTEVFCFQGCLLAGDPSNGHFLTRGFPRAVAEVPRRRGGSHEPLVRLRAIRAVSPSGAMDLRRARPRWGWHGARGAGGRQVTPSTGAKCGKGLALRRTCSLGSGATSLEAWPGRHSGLGSRSASGREAWGG